MWSKVAEAEDHLDYVIGILAFQRLPLLSTENSVSCEQNEDIIIGFMKQNLNLRDSIIKDAVQIMASFNTRSKSNVL